MCAVCNTWAHATCVGLTKAAFRYYLDFPEIDLTCSWRNFPFATVNHLSEVITEAQVDLRLTSLATEGNELEDELYGNEDRPNPQESSIVEERKKNSHTAFVAHLNINRLQNKFE